ncbi:unnamed protein product [Spirodela intermedia]|uniref:Uncharacterized protein n=1 Tax=Spirodela intermedia TaxID=51605 RepID=A0A7I8KBF0_SPIIN|nr:unnamed protein product [Spirodela intermedia]
MSFDSERIQTHASCPALSEEGGPFGSPLSYSGLGMRPRKAALRTLESHKLVKDLGCTFSSQLIALPLV